MGQRDARAIKITCVKYSSFVPRHLEAATRKVVEAVSVLIVPRVDAVYPRFVCWFTNNVMAHR